MLPSRVVGRINQEAVRSRPKSNQYRDQCNTIISFSGSGIERGVDSEHAVQFATRGSHFSAKPSSSLSILAATWFNSCCILSSAH